MTTRDLFVRGWSMHPALLVACAAALLVYVRAIGARRSKGTLALSTAAAVVLSCRLSPLDLLARHGLFCAHMFEHIVFVLVVPLLLVLALPATAPASTLARAATIRTSMLALPLTAPSHTGALRALTEHPLVAWLSGVAAMWIWHLPALYAAAHARPWLQSAELASLVALGFVFWLPVVGPPWVRRLDPLVTVLYLFTACVGCSLLGILVTFAPVGLYTSPFLAGAGDVGIRTLVRDRWGISARTDQQLGGLLMWVPCCLIYVSGSMMALARWYAAPPSAEERPGTFAAQAGSGARTVQR